MESTIGKQKVIFVDRLGRFDLSKLLFYFFEEETAMPQDTNGTRTYACYELAEVLGQNRYPGRGILIGKTEDGKKAQIVYFIMGRSANSQNRRFVRGEDQEIVIVPIDYSIVKNPELIIYSPVKALGNSLIVTNGNQTDTIYDAMKAGKDMREGLKSRCFEPDGPNWTPRISSVSTFENGSFTYSMSILKSADPEGGACNRMTFDYEPVSGIMHFIHTYAYDGNPLPTFAGEPERVRTEDAASAEELALRVWNALDSEYRISVYTRIVDLETGKSDDCILNQGVKEN